VEALAKKGYYRSFPDCAFEHDFWLVRKCRLTRQSVEQLTGLLASLVNSYRIMIGAADEFNRMSLAKQSDIKDAIERAKDLGDIIDDVIKRLDRKMDDYLDAVCLCDFEVQLLRSGIPQPPPLRTEARAEVEFPAGAAFPPDWPVVAVQGGAEPEPPPAEADEEELEQGQPDGENGQTSGSV
jgi:hypothetical protein